MHSTNVFAYIDVRAPAYTCIPYDKRVSPFSIRLLRTAGLDVKGTYKYELYRTASHLNSISNSLKPEAALVDFHAITFLLIKRHRARDLIRRMSFTNNFKNRLCLIK